MQLESKQFEDVSDEFFNYGLWKSGLFNQISVKEIKSWFKSLPDSHKIEESYWIEPPFSFALIKKGTDKLVYDTCEVAGNDSEVKNFVVELMGSELYNSEVEYDRLFKACNNMMQMVRGRELASTDYPDLYHARKLSSGFAKLYPYVSDDYIKDISYVSSNPLFVYHRDYKSIHTELNIPPARAEDLLKDILENFNCELKSGMIDTTLTENSRLMSTIGSENSSIDTTFTLSTYSPVSFTPVDLYRSGAYNSRVLSYLWLAVENHLNIVTAGETHSGKSSTMEALLSFVGKNEQIITTEEVKQISIPNKNWIPLKTVDNQKDEIDMKQLIQSSLRRKPAYVAVDEVTGEIAKPVFEAMNLGHSTIFTMHADKLDYVTSRLNDPPMNVPKDMIKAIDLVCLQKKVGNGDSETAQRTADIKGIIEPSDDELPENRQPSHQKFETNTSIEYVLDSHLKSILSKRNAVRDFQKELKRRSTIIEEMSNQGITGSQDVRYISELPRPTSLDLQSLSLKKGT